MFYVFSPSDCEPLNYYTLRTSFYVQIHVRQKIHLKKKLNFLNLLKFKRAVSQIEYQTFYCNSSFRKTIAQH